MAVIAPGNDAPPIEGVELDGARALWFHKVTCPVCQLAVPVAQKLSEAFPGRVVGIGQDPEDALHAFQRTYGITFDVVRDAPPYPASEAYGLVTVPTLVLVEEGRAVDVVESWDRDGYNGVAARLAEITGQGPTEVSTSGDGLPPFRPG